jgi:serine protease Do
MFDEQVVRLDQKIRPLLDQFVCVRMIQANGMDLSLFQFDYDLTFAAFFLNSDRTIYGRFGSRSSEKNVSNDISIEGFGKALEKALELHKGYPANKEELAGKQPKAALAKRPEELPSLKGKYSPEINLTGKIVPSCIHCHQIEEAERLRFRNNDQSIPEAIMFPWPMPDVLGLRMDPKECATVASLAPDSAAMRGGLRAEDRILELNSQPLISTADIQWVLETAKGGDKLAAKIEREGAKQEVAVEVPNDWRRKNNHAWRPSNWDLRRMALGGLLLKEATDEERAANKIAADRLALRVEYMGEYGEHGVAKKAGFKKNDIITAIDGQNKRLSESEAFSRILNSHKRGEPVRLKVKRGETEQDFEIKTQ